MKTYNVIVPVIEVSTGQIVELTAAQAADRKGRIETVKIDKDGSGTYRATKMLQFIADEEFGLEEVSGGLQADGLFDVKAEMTAADFARKAEAEKLAAELAKSKRKRSRKKTKPDETLIGSSVLPSDVEIAEGVTVPLGDVVTGAFEASEFTVEEWNGLAADIREAKLTAHIEILKAPDDDSDSGGDEGGGEPDL